MILMVLQIIKQLLDYSLENINLNLGFRQFES